MYVLYISKIKKIRSFKKNYNMKEELHAYTEFLEEEIIRLNKKKEIAIAFDAIVN